MLGARVHRAPAATYAPRERHDTGGGGMTPPRCAGPTIEWVDDIPVLTNPDCFEEMTE